MGDISEHFSMRELECKCGCGHAIIVPEMVHRLELVRSYMNIFMNISSWCRCVEHNKDVGGVDNSEHLTGEGVDVTCNTVRIFLRYLFVFPLFGFRRVIVYPGRFHVGIQPNKYQPYFEIRSGVEQWLKINY